MSVVSFALPQSAQPQSSEALAAALLAELPQHAMRLPLEQACSQGGWPGDIVRIELLDVRFTADTITFAVRLFVQEIIGGVACAAHQSIGILPMRAEIDRLTSQATFRIWESDSN
ncbi:hypothetical protein [Tuwongella immobilis]|uniref:Uncharacterized protein n=1 Tax=Tuwongella immobilis TaxID=692036 RepID=A0A6C2YJS0_9BACT|nr:hypothetical protein [Tuwongella immobilis]VIP01355.1 unnamed protein product [Tuwongella immobilis]VTR98158.1 unnamed protein product [Tuwongella immobilis]